MLPSTPSSLLRQVWHGALGLGLSLGLPSRMLSVSAVTSKWHKDKIENQYLREEEEMGLPEYILWVSILARGKWHSCNRLSSPVAGIIIDLLNLYMGSSHFTT